ncbi:MAG: phosphate acetyltransferase [Coriobacteriales bacterium]|jgi:phosphate acetyltransferase
MGTFLDTIISKASADLQTIVLPEGSDPRTLQAARQVVDRGIAKVIVLGTSEEVAAHGVSLDGIEVIDPATSPDRDAMAARLFELRKAKGMTEEEAHEKVADVLYCGVMMVSMGLADGMVAGACHATGDVLRPALQILKTAPGTKLVSAFFVMDVPDCEFGANGTFLFADCALNQYPDAEALSEIALGSAQSFRSFIGGQPAVAMLSHSTYGSAKGASIDKVREATALAREKQPDLAIDGELQLDAAIVPSVGSSKAPGSSVAGKANVLVFPDLDSANIGYKLVQRLAKAQAYGPVMQGIAKPVNDLSRGCSADDIVGVVAITAVQAQAARQ